MAEQLAINGGTPVRTKPMPNFSPGAAVIGEEEKAEVLDVLNARSPFRFYGPDVQNKTEQLEKLFCESMGVKYALAVTSGTAALKVSLLAAGVGPGDEVIVPVMSFIATAGVVVAAHARPVFVQIGPDMGIDPDDLEKRITDRTRAIIPVHILGGAAEMDPIMEVAERHGITVIEDCAQSAGATYKGRAIGSIGHVNAYSMQFQKVVTAGEGGVVATNDHRLWDRAIRAHDHGNNRWEADTDVEPFCAEVYRLNEMSGAFGLAQLRKLPKNLEVMRHYNKRLRDAVDGLSGMELRPLVDPDGATGQTVGLQFPDEDTALNFQKALNAEGIGAQRLYGGKTLIEHPQIGNQSAATKNNPFNSPLYDGPIEYRIEDYKSSSHHLKRTVFVWVSALLTDEDYSDLETAVLKVHAGLIA